MDAFLPLSTRVPMGIRLVFLLWLAGFFSCVGFSVWRVVFLCRLSVEVAGAKFSVSVYSE